MEAADSTEVARKADGPGVSAHEGIRSIFYYNTHVESGQTMALNIFELRYRIMVKRVMEEPSRNRELIFLPNFGDYVAASGDIGMLARVERYFPIPSDSSDPDGELPRAEIRLKLLDRVMVLWHWVEPGTKGLHECTFQRVPLMPSPQLLEPLRDAMHVSAVSRYTVRTQQGFLNIHSSPESPDNLENVIGQLYEEEEVVALEHRPGWVRHGRGWSVSRVRFDDWVWLVPEEPQELAPHALLMESSQNTNYSHLVMHGPSKEAIQRARRVYDQISPGSSAHVLAVQVPPVSETESVSAVLERLAAIYLRDALLPLVDDSGSPSSLAQLSTTELEQKLEAHGMDPSVICSKAGDHAELLLIANARLEVDRQPWSRAVAAADVSAKLLLGTKVLVACGAPCGLCISGVNFARNPGLAGGQPYSPHHPLVSNQAVREWGFSTPFDHFNPMKLSHYIRHQYTYEHCELQQCPTLDDEVIAHAASVHLSAESDPRSHAVLTPNYALIGRGAADALALKLLKRLNWCRLRLCFIGQREAGCMLALLDPEAMRSVLTHVLMDDYQPCS